MIVDIEFKRKHIQFLVCLLVYTRIYFLFRCCSFFYNTEKNKPRIVWPLLVMKTVGAWNSCMVCVRRAERLNISRLSVFEIENNRRLVKDPTQRRAFVMRKWRNEFQCRKIGDTHSQTAESQLECFIFGGRNFLGIPPPGCLFQVAPFVSFLLFITEQPAGIQSQTAELLLFFSVLSFPCFFQYFLVEGGGG